jgi:hypothetical protein
LPQNKAFETEINKALEDPLQKNTIKFFTPQEILNIIPEGLNKRIAPGYD